jgi:hypothetical protein
MQRRVMRDDFDITNELMKSRNGDSNTWEVCEEYELRGEEEADYNVVPKYSITERSKWKRYKPLEDHPDLFLKFARLNTQGLHIDAILDWTQRYGVLGDASPSLPIEARLDVLQRYGVWVNDGVLVDAPPTGHSTAGQNVEAFKKAVNEAAGALAMYEAVLNEDSEKAQRLVLEEFTSIGSVGRMNSELPRDAVAWRTRTPQSLISGVVEENYAGDYLSYALHCAVYEVDEMVQRLCYLKLIEGQKELLEVHHDPSRVRAGWGFKNLLGAMYLQKYWLMAAGGTLRRCENCGRIISLSRPSPESRKRRQDKRFCDDACRQAHHRSKKRAST